MPGFGVRVKGAKLFLHGSQGFLFFLFPHCFLHICTLWSQGDERVRILHSPTCMDICSSKLIIMFESKIVGMLY